MKSDEALTPRQIDALVVEKVMGLKCREVRPHPDVHSEWIDENENLVSYYSTDIAAAWVVVEHEQDKGHSMELQSCANDWKCSFSHDGSLEYTLADTAPMAICLAAIKAVGVDIDKLERKQS